MSDVEMMRILNIEPEAFYINPKLWPMRKAIQSTFTARKQGVYQLQIPSDYVMKL